MAFIITFFCIAEDEDNIHALFGLQTYIWVLLMYECTYAFVCEGKSYYRTGPKALPWGIPVYICIIWDTDRKSKDDKKLLL